MISSFVVFGQPKESIRVSIRQHGKQSRGRFCEGVLAAANK
ncbi:MAG: hypothetical protein ACLTL4_09040 [Hominisplanchenecus sp.]|jgi:hypothetical protein|nr:hypothetical protein [Faecalicatena fissicatena]